MLEIAVPNKGSLSEKSVQLLLEAGYRANRRGRELVVDDPENDLRIFFLRPRDIAVYVGQGRIHAGITGRDLLIDSGTPAQEYSQLGFARAKFRFAAPRGTIAQVREIAGKRVATSYRTLVENYLAERGIQADVVRLDGAVESSIQLGVADLIADVVETGSTLRAAGLEVFGEPLLESEAILITNVQGQADPAVEVLNRRLQGVLVAQQHVLVDYHVPVDVLPRAVEITPGFESPTVAPLADNAWRAVRAVVRRDKVNQVMDDLLAIGARGTIVTELIASRLG